MPYLTKPRWREVGARMKRARRSKGITQENLARRMGYDVRIIRRIETGQRALHLDEAVTIAQYIDVDLTYLAGTTAAYRMPASVGVGLRYAKSIIETAIKDAES